MASSIMDTPASSATFASCSTASSLRWFSGSDMSKRAANGGRPAAREPPAGKRAVGEDAHAVAPRSWQHVELDPADEQRVRGLLGAEALERAVAGGPLRLDDLPGRERGGADVADLALLDEVRQRAEGLVDIDGRVRSVHLVKVDPAGAEPPP